MWNNANKSEITCVLAGIILSENSIEISEESIKLILMSANVKIENYWPLLFSRLMKDFKLNTIAPTPLGNEPCNFETEDQKETLTNADKKKKNETEETKETKESEEDLGFGLFD